MRRKEGEREGRKERSVSDESRLWDSGGGFHGYLGCIFLHGLEVEEVGVDQVVAMDDGDQLPFDVVSLTEAQHLPQLRVLTHTHKHTFIPTHSTHFLFMTLTVNMTHAVLTGLTCAHKLHMLPAPCPSLGLLRTVNVMHVVQHSDLINQTTLSSFLVHSFSAANSL